MIHVMFLWLELKQEVRWVEDTGKFSAWYLLKNKKVIQKMKLQTLIDMRYSFRDYTLKIAL